MLAFLTSHRALTDAAAFLLALLEAVPVAGPLVPGSVLLVALGALVASGAVKLLPLLAFAILGAMAGDGFSYGLGRRFGPGILEWRPLRERPGLVGKSREFISRNGGRSIFLARFVPGLRGFVPLVAGTLRMSPPRFYIFNTLSALVWAPAHVLPGVALGASAALAGAAAGRLAVLALILVVMLWIVWAGVRLAVSRGGPLLVAGDTAVRNWAETSESAAARLLRPLLRADWSLGLLLVWAVVVFGAAWLFLGIMEDVVSGDPLVRFDHIVFQALQHLRTPLGDTILVTITELGDPIVTTSVTVAVVIWFAFRRAWRTMAFWIAAVAFASGLNTLIKAIIQRARPEDLSYAGASVFSFPSGHATVNAVLYVFLAFLVALDLRPSLRAPLYLGTSIFVALIGFSRLYLGAHWFSDVVAGLAFATAWVGVLGLVYIRKPSRAHGGGATFLVVLATLALVGGTHAFVSHAADLERYAPRESTPTMSRAEWLGGGWARLPAYRIDTFGEREEPFTLQWAGSLRSLETTLTARGWRKPMLWTAGSALAWLVTASPAQLPVLPRLDAGKAPALTLQMAGPSGAHDRLFLRIWPSSYGLSAHPSERIWLGSVVDEKLVRPLSLITLARDMGHYDRPRNVLEKSLADTRTVRRPPGPGSGTWDGRVLLGH